MATATLTTTTGTQYAFDTWEGQVQGMAPVVDYFARVGQTGTGAQTVRFMGATSKVTGNALFSSTSQAVAFQDACTALVGQRVRVDDWEGSFFVRIKGVTAVTRGGIYAAGGQKNMPYRVEAQFDLEIQ